MALRPGNSYRISGDGGSWGAITEALNVMAQVQDSVAPSLRATAQPLSTSVTNRVRTCFSGTTVRPNRAQVVQYAHPGGYPDPDNILGPHGTVGRVTESQARVQMVLWSLMPTQLILGEDVTKMSAEFVETVGNEELVSVALSHELCFFFVSVSEGG